MQKNFTIGMAGHIDHGKTALTKALTGTFTDRLKEEQEREISIEPGFASLYEDDELAVSIIDVPGHERFIRQMIAGVAGIDLFILVIAADEGMMPQTKEHIEILSLLDITDGIIVFTKIDEIDEEFFELVSLDVQEKLESFKLSHLPIYEVDSLSGRGITELKEGILEKINNFKDETPSDAFRLPIDQVFTITGQGTIVRGTVFDGEVQEGDELILLPIGKKVRVRQIERHHEREKTAMKGQRAAINISDISHEEIKRGDVLVSNSTFSVSDRLDVNLSFVEHIKYPIKQRQFVKVHIGTSEVMGRVIFFDRNQISPEERLSNVYCQLELEEKVVANRGDRFIVRRPSPAETIGGGWIIDAQAKKHRFGKQTVHKLKQKSEGTPRERIELVLKEHLLLSKENIARLTSLTLEQIEDERILRQVTKDLYTLQSTYETFQEKMITLIKQYHEKYPMRQGINKAEILSALDEYPEALIESALQNLQTKEKVLLEQQFVRLVDIKPTLPDAWKNKLNQIEEKLIKQNIDVVKWDELFLQSDIPEEIQKDFYYYLLLKKRAYIFDEDRLISAKAVHRAITTLKNDTSEETFTLQQARNSLHLTRKNLIPLLELLDELGITERIDNERRWL